MIMSGITVQEIIEATSGRAILKGSGAFSGFSIDSRTITESEIFVALRGARFDGHDFLDEALSKGAGAIVNYPPIIPGNGKTIIHVDNTLKALQDIARYKRNKRRIEVVGITGTNGKTTTKEMLCSILKQHCRVLCSAGNLNNQIGLPLNLVGLDDEEICVLEMGASKRGDITELCEIANPDYGIITNIGPAHLEGFGSLETVRDTKLELADYAKEIVINGDDEILATAVGSLIGDRPRRVFTYGIEREAEVTARNVETFEPSGSGMAGLSFDLHIKGVRPMTIALRVSGRFNVYNALAASSTAFLLGVPADTIKIGLEGFTGVPMRLEFKEIKGAVVISDVYNANPASMEEAVKELVRVKGKRAVAVLGDMLELGPYAEQAHRKLGAWLAELPVDVLVAVGPLMSVAASEFAGAEPEHPRTVYTSVDADDAKSLLRRIAKEGDTILIKGSRGMNMEHILEVDRAV